MIDGIERRVLGSLDDPSAVFVFPSEKAAASWLERSLVLSGRKALPASRFISWDAFKAAVFAGSARGRPASAELRAVFAAWLMAENARSPFLASFVPAGKAASSPGFAPVVARALPALRSVPEGEGPGLADWREIRRRYAAFLESRGMYEAAWLGRAAAPDGARYVLLYPDLTTDWQDYAREVEGLAGVSILGSESLGGEPVAAARFGTVVEEARAVLQRIRAEVESGADPAGMAISVASPESALPVLEREAAVAGIPLDVREGRPLSDSAGGRLIADIVDAARSRMGFESIRRLLLDRSRTWKDPETAGRLVGAGIAKHIVAPLPRPDGDVWERSLSRDDGARRLYRGLRTAADKVASATSFQALRRAFDAFRHAFMDETAWSPAQNDEIARCLAVLDALDEASSAAALDGPPAAGAVRALLPTGAQAAASAVNAADIYLRFLRDTSYLPVSMTSGIAVYDFPVAAGMAPELHFVMNLSESAARAEARPLSFLRPDERGSLGAADRDISSGLIRLLAVSGDRTFLSWSEDGPDGVRPAHPVLSAADAGGLAYARDAWLPDSAARASGKCVFPAQRLSAEAALATVFPGPAKPWTEGSPARPAAMEADNAAAIVASLSKTGSLTLSDTAIEDYAACAFRRVFQRGLHVEAVASGLSFLDSLAIGSLYHEALRRLLEPLAKAGYALSAGNASGSGRLPAPEAVPEALDAAIADLEADEGPMAAVLANALRNALLRDLSRTVDELRTTFDGHKPLLVEGELASELPGLDASLRGRIDLVLESRTPAGPGERPGVVVVDYKKSSVPGREELGPDESGEVRKLQIPLYAALSRGNGMDVDAAFYVSIEGQGASDKRAYLVFGPGDKPLVQPEDVPRLEPALMRAAARTADTIRRGLVYVPLSRDQEALCQGCDIRPVCRARYTVR